MDKGKVKWFDAKKGYGFITPDDGSEELFFHFSAIQSEGFKTVNEKDAVTYEKDRNAKGPFAVNVQKA